MNTIILPTDFSPAATNAAHYAINMALAINANLYLLHVYNLPVTYSEVPVMVYPDEIKENDKNQIEQLKEQLVRNSGGKIKIETGVNMGAFFSELEKVCEKINPYAVVIGNQGTTATERVFFGGHAIQAMTHLKWPLIAVPKGTRYFGIQKIGLACDLEKVIDKTPVDEISILVNDFNATLHVLNIGRNEIYDPEVVFESGLLQEMLFGLKPNYHFIKNKSIDEGILEFTETNNIDLLIMMPKRHSLLDKLIHKSHTKELVIYSHVPVMSLH